MKPKTKIFIDGADQAELKKLVSNSLVSGFTFNPTLFRKMNINNYLGHCKIISQEVKHHSISLEVIADDKDEMVRQGRLDRAPITARTPIRRIGEVADVVGPAIFLASDESAFIVGEQFVVDGGWGIYGFL